MICIFLGDVSDYLSHRATQYCPQAKLLTKHNFNNLVAGTYYTSLADLETLSNLASVLRQADKIVYAPPAGAWSDVKNGVSGMKNWTEDYLHAFSSRVVVENFTTGDQSKQQEMLRICDKRKTDSKQLWIAGCSVSHGFGVAEQEKYGCLLAAELSTPVTFLTCEGSSITWAADQIIRSNILKDDLVVWGITSLHRVPFFSHNTVKHINIHGSIRSPEFEQLFSLDYLDSEDLFYKSLTAIFQVINFCEKAQAKLLLASILDDKLIVNLNHLPNFIMLYKLWGRNQDELFLDSGNDDKHPGPKTHRFYADQMLKKLQDLNWA